MRTQNGTFVCAAIVGAMFLYSSAFARTARECTTEWRAAKAELQARGSSEKSYVDECQGGAAPVAVAPRPKPTTAISASDTTSKPIGGVPSQKTEKDCEDKWRADQVTMMAHGMTEDSYVEQCIAGDEAAPVTPEPKATTVPSATPK